MDAVEPDADMLAVLRARWPTVRAHRAGADRLPLPDAALDAVVVGTAWHWFPHDTAVAELRALPPGTAPDAMAALHALIDRLAGRSA